MRRAAVITCSTRAAAGTYADRSGPILVEALREWGFQTSDATVVPDGPAVEGALRAAVASGVALVLTTGGTGLTPTDGTPEATARVVDRLVPGIAEQLRAQGVAAGVPTAMLSRGLAGMAGSTLVVNLPGSTGGVRDAVAVLASVVEHAVSQIHGGDHHGNGTIEERGAQADRHGNRADGTAEDHSSEEDSSDEHSPEGDRP